MVTRLAVVLFMLWPAAGWAQNLSSAANQTLSKMFTQVGSFGPPPHAADPFACNAQTRRTTYYNTTSNSIFFCNGTVWGALGGAGGASTIQLNDDVRLFFGTGSDAALEYNATQTPDTLFLGVGADSRHLVVAEMADRAFDFAHAQATNPTLFIHSANQSTTQWASLSHDGTNAVIGAGTGVVTITSGFTVSGTNLINTNTPLYFGSTTGGLAWYDAQFTPDTFYLGTDDSTSMAIHIGQNADRNNDSNNGPCGTAVCTNPAVIIHPAATPSTTQYHSTSYYGVAGRANKTLTESAATSIVRIPIAASAATGGTVHYCVFAADATDQQQRCSFVRFSASNKAATETCGMTNNAGTADASITETEDGNAVSISSGTLTYAITCDVTPANAVDIQINAVSSLTQTTLEARWQIHLVGPGEPLPQ